METYLGKITASSARMSALIKNMLNYARLAHHEQLFEQTDLNAILDDIVSDFELLIEQKGAELEVGELPVIEAIPLQINQLFYNLISNALKFSRQDVAPFISISSRRLSEEEIGEHESLHPALAFHELVVRDNGIGFGEKYRQQIFTIFQRLNPSSQYLGTGIGLALCKKIAENHKGKIFACSKEGEGSAFHVILPAKQPK
jgi:two-component system CheB/CheR fusion protein